ncbi:hypothetical protein AYX61_02150 [Listeria monocytogenes]|uniref:HipA family kinase n=1 Tax=Listeria monocytogenes TaxID=1639 RepID=UPI00087490B3|nr:HipA family kinase [Listeria monocytogenes]EAD7000480.1 hypothetical protein [Listeria monocytogenes]EAF8305381.1 hypothetical protein [Listeria monocytogenes]EAG9257558.1 hypothetical protein [Listeria monocytogenes]EAG9269216.1 hypothetical protein [Listeria monocytogenes]EGP6356525.1 hypothetical protein [Listeria monocytogenes]
MNGNDIMGSITGTASLTVVSNVRNSVGNGITKPHFAMIENTLCVIKGINNPEKHLVLFNEYFGYRLAGELGLSIPEFGFATINQETTFDNEDKRKYFTDGCLCFFTKYIEKTVPLRGVKQLYGASAYDLISLFLYDLLICNNDRNPGNLLLRKPKAQNLIVYPIDYTHAFELQAIWDRGQLKRFVEDPREKIELGKISKQSVYQHIKEVRVYRGEEVEDCFSHFQYRLARINLRDILEEIPDVLLEKITKEDLDYFIRFIEIRIDGLNEIRKFAQKEIIGGDQL